MSEHYNPHFINGDCVCGCPECAGERQGVDSRTNAAICICPDCPCSWEQGRMYFTASPDKEEPVMEEDIGTVRWFGESWRAPVCDPRAHVETPVGEACAWGSGAPIRAADQGVGIPDGSTGKYVWYHLECWFRVIAGNVTEEVLFDAMAVEKEAEGTPAEG